MHLLGFKVKGSRPRSRHGQTVECVIAVGRDIHISWVSKYSLVYILDSIVFLYI